MLGRYTTGPRPSAESSIPPPERQRRALDPWSPSTAPLAHPSGRCRGKSRFGYARGRGASGTTRRGDGLRELRDGERGDEAVLSALWQRARGHLPGLWRLERTERAVLRVVRLRARGRRDSPGRSCAGADHRGPRSQSAGSCRSCSPTWSASRRSRRSATREDVRETLTRTSSSPATSSAATAGTVEKFIGDAVMAVWGAPVAHEDDAERAVRAALELVDAVRVLGPGSRRAPACSPARRPSRSAPRTRAWSRATSSTRPRGSSRSRPRARCSSARRPSARRARRSPSRRPASSRSRARRPGARWRAARRRRARRPRPDRHARGAVRRPRRRAAPAQGPVPRDRAREPGAARLGHRARRHRQEPARLGVRRSTSTGSSRTSSGTTAGARPTATASPSGRSARWSAAGPASLETRRRADDAARRSRRCSRAHVPDEDERRWIEPALLALLGDRDRRRQPSSSSAPGGRSSSGSPEGPVVMVFEDLHYADRACSTSSTTCSSGRRARPDLCRHARPARSCSSGGPTGAPASATSPRCTSSRCRAGDARAARGPRAGLPEARSRRSSRGPTGSRSTRSRRCGCCSLRAASTTRRRRLRARSATSRASPSRRPSTALIASRLDGLDAGRPRPDPRTPPSSGQSFTPGGPGRRVGPAGGRRSSRACGRSSGASSSSIAADPRRRSAASTRSSRRSSARSPTTRWRGRSARRATSPPRATSRALGDRRARRRARQPLPRRPGERAGGPGGAMRSAGQARIALRARPSGPRRSARTSQAIAFLEQALAIDVGPGNRIELLTRLGDSAAKAARYPNSRNRRSGSRRRSPGRPAIGSVPRPRSRRSARCSCPRAGRPTPWSCWSQPWSSSQDLPEDPGVLAIRSQLARALHFLEAYRESLAIPRAGPPRSPSGTIARPARRCAGHEGRGTGRARAGP